MNVGQFEKGDAMQDSVSRFLVILGLVLVVLGLLWPLVKRLGLGQLPGDLHFGGDGWSVHVLLGTSIVLSIVLTILLNLFFWFMNR